MTVSECYPAIHLGGLSNIIFLEIGIMFSGTKTFCFENSVFSHLAYECVRESVRAQDVGMGVLHSHP